MPGDRLAIVVADVSGKGVPAALLMVLLCTEARYCLVSERRPADAIGRLNANFMDHDREDHIVTLALVVLDLHGHTATIALAGHMAPLLRRGERISETVGEEIRGLPIGVNPHEVYKQCTVRLAPGDSLTVFTDGLNEARNAEQELYGLANLRAQLDQPGGKLSDLGRRILTDIKRFVGKEPTSDDMCLVCVGRL